MRPEDCSACWAARSGRALPLGKPAFVFFVLVMPAWFIFCFLQVFLSVRQICLVQEAAASFVTLVLACAPGQVCSPAAPSVQVRFGQSRVTNDSLQPSAQVCVSLGSVSLCHGAGSSTGMALSMLLLLECKLAAAAQEAKSALGKRSLLLCSHVCTTARGSGVWKLKAGDSNFSRKL